MIFTLTVDLAAVSGDAGADRRRNVDHGWRWPRIPAGL
jgi:hypothetical protein